MKKQFFLSLLIASILISSTSFSQVKVIFDTDFGGDVDDLGALVMLHNFVDKRESDLLAVMCWSTEQNAPWIKEYYKGRILDNSTFE